MASTDLARLEQRARRAYEFGRLRRALLGIAPMALLVPIFACLSHRPGSVLAFGAAVIASATAMLWYGRDPQKAVLPGVAAGLVPLVLALCANQVHACASGRCSTLCVPACALGGVVAGLAVAWVGNRRKAGVGFWVSSSGLALLTGAMGCSCVGYSGLVGLGLGFAGGVVPVLVRQSLRAKAP